MATLSILHHPDPRLRQQAREVEVFDRTLAVLVDDMLETMYAAPGIGLAAIQVNVPLRVIVLDVTPDGSAPLHFVNPRILGAEGAAETTEGCLSVPGVFEVVQRAERIRVAAQDRDGKPFELDAEGLLAVCIQHEIDHLAGRLFVDYLSQLKQRRIRKKLEKEQRLVG